MTSRLASSEVLLTDYGLGAVQQRIITTRVLKVAPDVLDISTGIQVLDGILAYRCF